MKHAVKKKNKQKKKIYIYIIYLKHLIGINILMQILQFFYLFIFSVEKLAVLNGSSHIPVKQVPLVVQQNPHFHCNSAALFPHYTLIT